MNVIPVSFLRKGIQDGQILRIAGEGMPGEEGNLGDLLGMAELRVRMRAGNNSGWKWITVY